MGNSESIPSEKELLPEEIQLLPEELQGVVRTHAIIILEDMDYNVPSGYRLVDNNKNIEKVSHVLVNFWFNMQRAYNALPDPEHEIPSSNTTTEKTPREDLIDVAVLSILENVQDLWPQDKDILKKELRDELMDLLERVVESVT